MSECNSNSSGKKANGRKVDINELNEILSIFFPVNIDKYFYETLNVRFNDSIKFDKFLPEVKVLNSKSKFLSSGVRSVPIHFEKYKNSIDLKAFHSFKVKKIKGVERWVSPNADVIAAVTSIMDVKIEDYGDRIYRIPQGSVSLIGLLRALLLLKELYPEIFKFVRAVARVFSYELDENIFHMPFAIAINSIKPDTILYNLEDVLKIAEKIKVPISYIYTVATIKELERIGLLDKISVFDTKVSIDRELIAQFMEEFKLRIGDGENVFKDDNGSESQVSKAFSDVDYEKIKKIKALSKELLMKSYYVEEDDFDYSKEEPKEDKEDISNILDFELVESEEEDEIIVRDEDIKEIIGNITPEDFDLKDMEDYNLDAGDVL